MVNGETLQAGVSFSQDQEKALMDLAGIVAVLIGGPYAHLAYSLVKVGRTFMTGYRTPPEFKKYYDSLEELTKAYEKRHGGKQE